MTTIDFNVDELLDTISISLREHLRQRQRDNPLVVGVRTGGVWVARELMQRLGVDEPLGTLNINFYRDDFTRIGVHPTVAPSDLPFSVEDRHIVLVDDVLYTGRTIRAALNEIFDFGRPASVTLVVLVERSGREIPIHADVVGKEMDLEEGQSIKLNGPTPLTMTIQLKKPKLGS